jgi:hypothetical protein
MAAGVQAGAGSPPRRRLIIMMPIKNVWIAYP